MLSPTTVSCEDSMVGRPILQPDRWQRTRRRTSRAPGRPVSARTPRARSQDRTEVTARPSASGQRRADHEFVQRSNATGVLLLVGDWMLYAALVSVAVYADRWWVTVLSIGAIGMVQFAIGEVIVHEASHRSLFRSAKWNERLAFLFALPFGFTLREYRHEHMQHHRHMGTERDHLTEDYETLGLNDPEPNMLWLWWFKPVLGYAAWRYVRGLVEERKRRDWLEVSSFWAVVAGVCAWAGALDLLLLYWVLPMLVCFTTLLYWAEIEDHFRTRTGTRSNVGRLYNLMTHNSGYHYVHHKYPKIPWHQLRKAHDELCPQDADISYGLLDTYRQVSRPCDAVGGQEADQVGWHPDL